MAIIGIWAYMITLYIRPQDWVPFFLNQPVNDWIIPITLLAGMVETGGERRPLALPQTYLLLLFLAFVFLSNAVHGHFDAAQEQLVICFKRVVVFFMFVLVLNSHRKIKHILQFVVVLAVVLAIQGIYQSKTGVGWAGQPLKQGYEEVRITWIGDWDGPNVLALLFVVALALNLEFVFGPYGFWCRIVNSVFSVILLWGVYLTNSRGGWLGVLAVIAFYFRGKFRSAHGLIAGALIALAVLSLSPSRMTELHSEEKSAHEHIWGWEQGLGLIESNPIWGIGKGQFEKYTDPPLLAHNNYLQVSAEVGLVGSFVWLSILYLSMKGLYKIQRRPIETTEQSDIVSLARAMLTAMIGFNVVTFFVTMEMEILFVLWALCAAIILLGRKIFTNLELKTTKMDLAAVCCGMVGILGVIYILAVRQPL